MVELSNVQDRSKFIFTDDYIISHIHHIDFI
ncbi:hypothetical protein WP7S18C02_21700 [Klebsiella sp. WP7-S18-CRE-02]|nr:hypothetical protein WP7S18C02_21700 [Klebsiella sp. WP7-S18-CRE-02]BBS96577.1 hypothetical protein WP7S18C03_21700 [Klebsiella sp. WP7-S18-CRE-03]BBT01609.1 hypothetical protein WP7S18E04_21710 [Klebsiella sp. WP7-S18-ESBL-04]